MTGMTVWSRDAKPVSQHIEEILQLYEHDPEAAHGREDALLWAFVHRVAAGEDPPGEIEETAQALLRLFQSQRVRMYA